MTLKELSQVRSLRKEIEMDKAMLWKLQSEFDFTENPEGFSNISRQEFDFLQGEIIKRQAICMKELTRLEKYITQIDDSLTRRIFVYRFINGMNWIQVARAIGGGNTPDSVKKRCQRYVWNHK